MIRSLLFAPANRHDLIGKFFRAGADRYVIDLEDGTPPDAKEAARADLATAVAGLRAQNIQGEVYVRLNQPDTRFYKDDILAALAADIDGVVVPKLEDWEQIHPILDALTYRDRKSGRSIAIMAGIESAKGVVNIEKLATAHPLITSLYFGAEDFIADMGGRRTPEGSEVFFARSKAVLAAKVSRIVAVDQIATNLRDEALFRRDASLGRDLGYDGKMCLTPTQVSICNEIFAPSDAEVEYARELVAACEKAAAEGIGTFSFRGNFVDAPILKKARGVLVLAECYKKSSPSGGA